jgi:transcription initiation factor TFIID subunit 5
VASLSELVKDFQVKKGNEGGRPSCALSIIICVLRVGFKFWFASLAHTSQFHSLVSSSTSTTSSNSSAWEESTGLLSSLIPQSGSATSSTSINPQAYNASKGGLKLGFAPLPEELRTETERIIREQALIERDPTAPYDIHYNRPTPMPGVIAPTEADLLPGPPSFKLMDIKREVEKAQDVRKRIKLDPTVLNGVDPNSAQASAVRAKALPSVCAYTLHDVPEG